MPPFTLEEPKELDFLESVSGFHSGYLSILTRARTMEFYEEVATRFKNMLTSLEGMRDWITDDRIIDGAYFSIEKGHIDDLYEPFGLEASYPFHNLVCRISLAYQAVRAHLAPHLQSLFLSDFPVELLYLVISFVADSDIPALANTCKGLRLLCGQDRRLHKRLFFRMRYSMEPLHISFPPLQEDLYLDIIEHMETARRRVSSSMRALANAAVYTANIRYISWDNEWDHKWPSHVSRYLLLPPPTDTQIFEPLYNHIVNAIAQLPVQHVRFVSLAISRRILDHIARHPRVTRLTIERYTSSPSLLEVPSLAPKLLNVTFLAIGFHGDQYTHRTQWRLITMFPALRHLYAYTCDVTDVAIRYPIMYGSMFHIHSLETLHIQGSSRYVEALTRWISLASAVSEVFVPGRLQRFKLQTRKAVPYDEARHLVTTLAACHPNIRILVLEGLDHVYPDFVGFIARSFSSLQGLSIVRYKTGSQTTSRVCDWNEAIFKYAEMMCPAKSLRHLEINTLWPSPVLSPRLLAVLYKTLHCRNPLTEETGWERLAGGGVCDVTSIALPFATHCPSTETFAIRCGECFFSCRIHHPADGKTTFSDVRSVNKHDRFESWNPKPGSTWDCDD
ncbi:hypothetical protein AURDEDRAFT_172870 [Auricularia subglabra TFB-10046 SS5]|uniref:F-box domain-containing protein n=1 Tax=Auricularia subglabra (strain TFB-10046 / SS5) TaxID=717982 RepID=J0WWZ2_AURST|nr:hypothetical protein AURDEDRAFT_172870 [Auricularia subglabra TFB-10046 SS5]